MANKKGYKALMEDAIKAKQKADKALDKLAIDIGRYVIKSNNYSIESLQDFKANYQVVKLDKGENHQSDIPFIEDDDTPF